MQYVIDNMVHLSAGFGALVTLATAVTKLTPTKADDKFLAKALELFSLIKKS